MAEVVLIFGLAVLVFDGVWSLIVRTYHFNYSSLWFVSSLLYFGAGLMVGRTQPLPISGLTGLTVGTIDATLGWLLSAAIGPGMRPNSTIRNVSTTIVFVALMGLLLGMLGGAVANLFFSSGY